MRGRIIRSRCPSGYERRGRAERDRTCTDPKRPSIRIWGGPSLHRAPESQVLPMIHPSTSILDLLHGDHAAVLMGVHNAMIAKVAEEAGADGLWISSFELHAAARLPDADILGPEDYNDVVSKIVDRVSIPVLVD